MYKAIAILLYIFLGPLLGGLLAGFDRKLTARFQGRKGPPLLQPFYDIKKLFSKPKIALVLKYLVMSFRSLLSFGIMFLVMSFLYWSFRFQDWAVSGIVLFLVMCGFSVYNNFKNDK